MAGPACIDCIYYVKPSLWKRFSLGIWAERCSHPNCLDDVDGSPLPCATMRLLTCERGQLFKPKQATRP